MLKLKTDYLYGLNDCLEDEYKEEYTVLVSNKFPLLPINDDRASQLSWSISVHNISHNS